MAVHIDDDICIRMGREIRGKFFFLLFFHSSDLSKKEKKNYSLNIDRLEIRNLRSTRKVNLNRATWHLNLGPMH